MLITRLQEQIEVDLETAHGQVAADPAVSEDTKLIAAAIAQAGAQIALALSQRDEST